MAAEREALMETRLAEELGRPPTEVELAAAREANMQARMTSKLGHPPTTYELAAAREQQAAQLLESKLGRPPTEAELAAARDVALQARGGPHLKPLRHAACVPLRNRRGRARHRRDSRQSWGTLRATLRSRWLETRKWRTS